MQKTGLLSDEGHSIVEEIKPFEIGDFCFCYFSAPYVKDAYFVTITEVTPSSTKLPAIFSNDLIQVGGISL